MVNKIKKSMKNDPVLAYKLALNTILAITVILIGVGINQVLYQIKEVKESYIGHQKIIQQLLVNGNSNTKDVERLQEDHKTLCNRVTTVEKKVVKLEYRKD